MEILNLLSQSQLFLLIVTFSFSLLIGSFLNVVIYRYPKSMQYEWTQESIEHLSETFDDMANTLKKYADVVKPESIVWTRSHCQNCNHQIRAWENIPVFSFIFLRGKCSDCKAPISHRYWLVELLTAILSAFVVYKFGWSWESLVGVFLTWMLIVIALIDFDTMVIPDGISLPLLWVGLFISIWAVFVDSESSIKGALLGYLLLWSIFHLFKLLTGKEGMGYGDFKLLAAGGAWFGMSAVAVILVMSSAAGAVIGSVYMLINKDKRSQPIPFGPYLAVGIWITMLYGNNIIDWYLGASGLS